MADKESRKRRKGRFSPLFLPVNKGYVTPASRRWMIIPGALACLALVGYTILDANLQRNSFIMRGQLSSNHADFETNCQRCHHPVERAVTDANCSACHEKTSEFAVYDFAAHYQYRSLDLSRRSPELRAQYRSREMQCGICHVEHAGRDAAITQVTDARCLSCHRFSSFGQIHPEFDFAAESTADDSTLIMTHNRHTGFVLALLQSVDKLDKTTIQLLKQQAGEDSLFFFEPACLYCHEPDSDGKNFINIDFEQHCGACHLGSDKAVIGLPAFDPKKPRQPGVLGLETLQKSGGPGILWAYSANQSLVRNEFGEVSKMPVFHKDPWIMENLKRIRMQLFGSAGLTDLLQTSATTPPERVDSLYSEAIQTLQTYVDELQNRPELKGSVKKMNALLRQVRGKLSDPTTPRSPETFAMRDTLGLTEADKAAYLQLASDLTDINGPECQKCHLLENAFIARVQAGQEVLRRAEFDHRAHVLEQRCTECHTKIAFTEQTILLSTSNPDSFKTAFSEVYEADMAHTQNLPAIENCRQCHSPEKAADRCVTCHRFHPNKSARGSLQLFSTDRISNTRTKRMTTK